jgi:hypothetical protein
MNYDMMEFPQDDAFAYSRQLQGVSLGGGVPEEDEGWSSSSGEDVEEVIHRIVHGKGSVSAVMADGSEPAGIFVGMTEEELKNLSGTSPRSSGKGGGGGGRSPAKKGKRGRKSEGLNIRRIPFDRVALAEELLKEVQSYKAFPGLGIETPDTPGGRRIVQATDSTSQTLMIQGDPIRSEMMLTSNHRDGAKNKELSKGIPVVSPLTRLKQMFVKASRLPEEAAVIARAKELDEIQASIRFGKLNESAVHVNSNIQDYVRSGKVVDEFSDMEEFAVGEEGTSYGGGGAPDPEEMERRFAQSYYPEGADGIRPPSLTVAQNAEYGDEQYAVLSLEVDTEDDDRMTSDSYSEKKSFEADQPEEDEENPLLHRLDEAFGEGEEGRSRAASDPSAGASHERSSSSTRADYTKPRRDDSILMERMNSMTKKMVMHEKRVKKIVSDDNLAGLCTVMMKGTVLDIFMYDILECIRRRPSEGVVLSDGKILRGQTHVAEGSPLRMGRANKVMWKEQDIFSLCGQLVDLQRERTLYRQKVMGVSGLWDDMSSSDKRAVLGDPCDVSYCGRYFRPPVGCERPCVWETECVCYLIGQSNIFPDTLDRVVSDTAFIGREFYTPDKDSELRNRSWPEERRACLLCYDIATLYAHYYYKRNDQSAPFLLQNHWNKTEGENAYSPALCFPLIDNDNRWTGFIAPKVMRILTSLRPYETNVHVNGTMKTVPCFVEACQDFWLASTALAGLTRSEISRIAVVPSRE